MRITRFLTGAAAAGVLMLFAGGTEAAEELNALVWCDHSDPALLEPFEKANNVKVNTKEYEGTGAGLSIVEQSQPGDWDVFVVDGIDVPRVVEKGLLAPMDEKSLPVADMYPELVMREQTAKNGQFYAISEKFGYNTISFNKDKVKPADMQSLAALFGPDYKGRIAVYDYYLPVMGMVALSLGKKTADLTEADLPAIREALFKLKENSKLVGEITASQTALATGEVDVLVGGGEFVTATLHKDNPALDFSIPKEGGVRWSQAIGIFKDSKKKDLALKFVQYIMSPEGQARLATSSCYWGVPTNAKAALSDEQKAVLRFNEQADFLKRAQLYPAPNADLDAKMQAVWTEFLNH